MLGMDGQLCWAGLFLFAVNTVAGLPQPIKDREKRDTENVYYVDVLAIGDNALYNRWTNGGTRSRSQTDDRLKNFLALVLHQANDRLATLDQYANVNYVVQIKMTGVLLDQDILSGQAVNPATGGRSAETALRTLKQWVFVRPDLLASYDHVILFTGYELEDQYENQSVSGKAFVGSICAKTGDSVSVVEATGGFQATLIAAHEVAHGLGALHDGEQNMCSVNANYLMAARGSSTSNTDQPWYLSSCSATAIDTQVQIILGGTSQTVPNCLATSPSAVPEFVQTKGQMAGQVYDPHQQCKLVQGEDSHLCVGEENFGSLEEICTSMHCKQSERLCSRHFAAEGTTCGNKMWCQMGKCVYSADAPVLENPQCAYGDAFIQIGGQSCAEYLPTATYECYREEIESNCCGTCATLAKASAPSGCKYGDKQPQCEEVYCNLNLEDGRSYAEVCCETCSYNSGGNGSSTCTDVSSIDGVTCAARIVFGGRQECYDDRVATQCCASCAALKTDVHGCEYGDRLLTCSNTIKSTEDCTSSNYQSCCKSCQSYNSAGQFVISYHAMIGTLVLLLLHNFSKNV